MDYFDRFCFWKHVYRQNELAGLEIFCRESSTFETIESIVPCAASCPDRPQQEYKGTFQNNVLKDGNRLYKQDDFPHQQESFYSTEN